MYVRTLTCSPLLSTKLMRVWVSSLSQKDDINVARSMPKHTHNDVFFWPFVFPSYDAHRPVRCPCPTVHAEACHAVARPQQTHAAKTTRGRKWSMDACQHPLLNYACTAGPKYPHTTHWILLHKRQCVFAAATHTKCAKKERAQPQPRRASLHAHLSNRTHAWAKRFTPHATFTATVAQ